MPLLEFCPRLQPANVLKRLLSCFGYGIAAARESWLVHLSLALLCMRHPLAATSREADAELLAPHPPQPNCASCSGLALQVQLDLPCPT